MRGGFRVFRHLARFRYFSSLGEVTVEAGEETDGASIPTIFWSVLMPYGPYFPAAAIHDHLYSAANDKFTRQESDDIFKEAMFNIGVDWMTREIIYRSVRLFGGKFFKGTLGP